MSKTLFMVMALGAAGYACAAGTIPGGTLSLTQTYSHDMLAASSSSGTSSGSPASSVSSRASAGINTTMSSIETYSFGSSMSTADTSASSTGSGSGNMNVSISSEYHALAETDGEDTSSSTDAAMGFGGFGNW